MNIEDDDDDDLLSELNHELKNTQASKVSFKRKSFNKPQKIQRNKLSFNIDEEEEHDGDEDIKELKGVTTQIKSKGSSLLRFNPRAKFTKEKSSEPEQSIKKPINLSRYQIDSTTTTSTPVINDNDTILFELDEDDPENNPVITNIDDLKDEDSEEFVKLKSKLTTSSQQLRQSQVLSSVSEDTSKRYVPIETNRDPESSKLTARQYANALVNEYKDDKNYDDGTERQNQEDQEQLLNDINDGDIELNDEDMGTLNMGKRSNFDDNKFNFEIHSDDADQEESDGQQHSENESYDDGNIEFSIPTIEEQIIRINGLIKQFEVTKSEKQKLIQNLKIEQNELSETKSEVLEKLNNLVI
ncbi:putative uncharacterized protein [Candida dubliniensis CD36]|uniref:Uncharacterized protein n=1 Tax=Candida dubliniensis (strain CD36 / ATCC MYA-646 / CBS 7987 / NCPF 3949 / NRRL Y-17841) TaxID=573826 RepID=B9WJ37_CANDC|nr:putative uncharacterized protein [Candida dubliniensis CD36]CAX41257.1 putative uncharacterized protein [Candida dubliniensis CD36]